MALVVGFGLVATPVLTGHRTWRAAVLFSEARRPAVFDPLLYCGREMCASLDHTYTKFMGSSLASCSRARTPRTGRRPALSIVAYYADSLML